MKRLSVIVALAFGLGLSARADEWSVRARRLVGTSGSKRDAALAALRSVPDLETKVRAALAGPDRPLALEVIGALQLRRLLPALYAAAKSDADGGVFLTLASLVDDRKGTEILNFFVASFRARDEDKLSVPAQMVLLDTFARTGHPIPEKEAKQLLRHDSPELRATAMRYVRSLRQRPSAKTVYPSVRDSDLQEEIVVRPFRVEREGKKVIRIVFGYKDTRPARLVGDRYERAVLVDRLTRKCSGNDRVCGFDREKGNPDQFSKENISLGVFHSSVGPDDEENVRDPLQNIQSEIAERAYYGGLSETDVLLYNGHSREGGGPDFRPPRTRAQNFVDFAWYRRNTPGLSALIAALTPTPRRVQHLGFYSCDSTQHFRGKILAVAPSVVVHSSPRLLYYTEAMEEMTATLAEVMGPRT